MKSIILLAMSTLNANVFSDKPGDDFSVTNEEGIIIKDCKSQLEPVVRYFLRDSQCSEQVEVLMLCTRQTLEIATDRYGIKYKNTEGKEVDNVSAVTFLMDRINNCPEKGEKEITYKAFPLYQEGTDKHLPQIQCGEVLPNTDERIGMPKTKENALEYARAYEKAYPPDYLSGMREAIQGIRKTVADNREKEQDQATAFYIVTHGGPRDVMLSLNAVISLLDEEGIEPTKICGTNLATKMIEDQKASFDMFRFVSGMRDFLNSGNVDVLQRYYSDSTTFLHGTDRQEENKTFQDSFLKAMNQVAIGIQYSNPENYNEGLSALNEVMTSNKNTQLFNSNLGIFKDTIQSDFGLLLDTEKRTVIDMVERCINKKQYQQALTFLESAFPEYYGKKGIISFSGSDEKKRRDKFNDFLNNYLGFVDKKKSPKIIIVRFCTSIREGKTWEEAIIDDINWNENLETRVKEYLDNRESIYERDRKSDPGAVRHLIIDSSYDFVADILPILKMHKTLKSIRNGFSHSDGEERPEISDLGLYMRYYLKALKNLVKNQDSKTFTAVSPAFADNQNR